MILKYLHKSESLGVLCEHRQLGPTLPFPFIRSRMGPDNLHFNEFRGDSDVVDSRTQILITTGIEHESFCSQENCFCFPFYLGWKVEMIQD